MVTWQEPPRDSDSEVDDLVHVGSFSHVISGDEVMDGTTR